MSYTVEINVFSVWTLHLHICVIKKTQNVLLIHVVWLTGFFWCLYENLVLFIICIDVAHIGVYLFLSCAVTKLV